MTLAMAQMDPTVQGIFFLVAVVVFAIAVLLPLERPNLIALGLAAFAVPFMWNAFAAG